MLDSTLTGVYIADRNGDYIFANAGFLKMSGGVASDIPRMNVFNMEKDGFVSQSAALSAFREKKRITMINHVNNQKGYFYNQLITATPLFDASGEIEYVVVEMLNLRMLGDALNQFYGIEEAGAFIDSGDYDKALSADMIAVSPEMKRVRSLADEVAAVNTTVLLTGETGTGKDVLARYIHAHSARKDREMVEINCAALPEALLESELFGYEKGAYTGALASGKEGLIQKANGGTLFLDEVNSMSLSVQGKLLRVLEDGYVRKLGSLEKQKVEFRLIAATNQDLKNCIENKTFREDLYYRLSIVPFKIPPLRERRADILPLAQTFLKRFNEKYERTKILTPQAIDELLSYDWPGNVRELRNVIERLVVTTSASTVEVRHVPIAMLDGDLYSNHAPAGIPVETLDWDTYYMRDPNHATLKNYLSYCEEQALRSVFGKGISTRDASKIFKVDQSGLVRKRQKYSRDDT